MNLFEYQFWLIVSPESAGNFSNYSCGADRVRTDDLFVANEALSQLSYSPGCYIRALHTFLYKIRIKLKKNNV